MAVNYRRKQKAAGNQNVPIMMRLKSETSQVLPSVFFFFPQANIPNLSPQKTFGKGRAFQKEQTGKLLG